MEAEKERSPVKTGQESAEGHHKAKEERAELTPPGMGNEVNLGVTAKKTQATNEKSEKKKWFGSGAKAEKKKEEKQPVVPLLSLFRYATKGEKVMVVVGCVASVLHGAIVPMFDILFGKVINQFGPGMDLDRVLDDVKQLSVYFLLLGVGSFVTSFLQVSLLMTSAQRQGRRMRSLYLRSLMAQEMEWYDQTNPSELTARVSGDVGKVEDGIGDRVGTFFQYASMGLTGLCVGLAIAWKLTLVILTSFPVLIVSGAILGKLTAEFSGAAQSAYAKAGAVAEEAFSLIRTVAAFGGEEKEKARYDKELQDSVRAGIKQANATGVGLGISMGSLNLVFAIAFWYGNKLVNAGELTAGEMVTVFFSVVFGGVAIGQISPSLTAFAIAQGAAYHLFQVIDREPIIDNLSLDGDVPAHVNGTIEFDRVDFNYSTRQHQKVLSEMTFKIKSGQTIALVGPSGCGKSTTIQLLERFYDPTSGAVRLDGRDIRELNLPWLRSQISLVSQMPSLFAMTIAENIALGARLILNKNFNASLPETRPNRRYQREAVSREDIERAAKMANAHNFIVRLPQGYDTMVGERGAMLSGGQKQRIAIARALIKDPKILLLDEATSALDSESERVVAQALEKASEGRTTVVIAHRLSTIQNADQIGVVDSGRIVELGTHTELMDLEDGRYRRYVLAQQLNEASKEAQTESEGTENVGEKINDQELEKKAKNIKIPGVSKENEEQAGTEESDILGDAVDTFWKSGVTGRAFGMVKGDAAWISLGVLGALGAGAVWPSFSVVFTKIITVILENDQSKVNMWVIIFVVLAVVVFLANYIREAALGLVGQRLTYRLRSQLFDTFIHQPIGWFDDQSNAVGILSARLSNDAAQVKGLTGDTLGGLVTQLSTILIGVVIAFTASWKLSLVVLVCVPAIGVGSVYQMRQMSGFAVKGNKSIAEAGKLAAEAVDNVRTVTAFNAAYEFLDRYTDMVNTTIRPGIRKAVIAAAVFAFTEFMQFAIWAIAFYYGSILVGSGEISFEDMLLAISSIVFGVMTAGQASALTPDLAKAKVSAKTVFSLIDLKSSPDVRDKSGVVPDTFIGRVALKDAYFEYPSRPEVTVLRGLNVTGPEGQLLALVGESGCGKSTIVGLLERFYGLRSGQVLVDDRPVEEYNLSWLRSQMGIVSQEPDLFNTTVRANILYGLPSHELSVITDETVYAAARLANAHDFILALPNGYDTVVGYRGSHLSGGQRQRVAIARALIRNPKILLLDEATSALDSESERLVQEALDRAQSGRTVVSIAHRLATIQGANRIAVVRDGVVAELGTHPHLLAMGGLYSAMVHAQSHR